MPTREQLLARAAAPSAEALRLHPFYKGKIQTLPKVPVRGVEDFAIWYTPGVAAPCKAIQAHPELAYEHTNRGNSVAVVSDGTRVLGLGDIGPEAGMPVMEGKALLFKHLGGVDAVPICLGSKDPNEIVRAVELLEPSFGGINLEDIAQPKCFRVLERLKRSLKIPVWHDDQQGTATVLLAALMNALKVVGKELRRVRIAMIGMGAANVAGYRLLKAAGVDLGEVIACDSRGILGSSRGDVEARQREFPEKWEVCRGSNARGRTGGIAEALSGADVCISFAKSDPGLIKPEWIKTMAKDAIVFACANPQPEIWPWDAKEAGARVVGSGRSDFPNQINNSLGFPAIFRGALDVRASAITDEMALAAAHELAAFAEDRGLSEDNIMPRMDDWELFPRVAAAVGMRAQNDGVAKLRKSRQQLQQEAEARIGAARETMRCLLEEGLIPAVPE